MASDRSSMAALYSTMLLVAGSRHMPPELTSWSVGEKISGGSDIPGTMTANPTSNSNETYQNFNHEKHQTESATRQKKKHYQHTTTKKTLCTKHYAALRLRLNTSLGRAHYEAQGKDPTGGSTDKERMPPAGPFFFTYLRAQ